MHLEFVSEDIGLGVGLDGADAFCELAVLGNSVRGEGLKLTVGGAEAELSASSRVLCCSMSSCLRLLPSSPMLASMSRHSLRTALPVPILAVAS